MMRDLESNALLSTDRIALDKHRAEKQKLKRMSELEKEVQYLRLEIKTLSERITLVNKER